MDVSTTLLATRTYEVLEQLETAVGKGITSMPDHHFLRDLEPELTELVLDTRRRLQDVRPAARRDAESIASQARADETIKYEATRSN
jgi:hypothetical protein